MEACFGCGVRAASHPVVAIMKRDETIAAVATDPAKIWMAVPACAKCHAEPKNRTVVIKGAFFLRQDAEVALRLADMQNLRTVPAK